MTNPICPYCKFPVPIKGALVRHFGTHVAHTEDECLRLLRAENERLRTLARDAYTAWDTDRDARVGKLLLAMVDADYCRTYRPDLMPNAARELIADARRFRWLTEDHSNIETRFKCRELLSRMGVMSYSAACASIDAAIAQEQK